MRLTSLSTPTYNPSPATAFQAKGFQNVAQAQKAEAFTPSGRIQRQGFANAEQVGLVIAAINKQLNILNPEIFFGNLSFLDSERHRAWLLARLYPCYQAGLLITKFELEQPSRYPGFLDLQGLDLQGADLQGLQLKDAQLLWTQLRQANLREAELPGADLRWAILSDADLTGAKLQRAKLSNTDLTNADLTDTGLQGANLHEANLSNTALKNADLRGAFGVPLGITSEQLASARNTTSLKKCLGLSRRINRSTSQRKEALELELKSFIDEQEQLREPPQNFLNDPLLAFRNPLHTQRCFYRY